MKLFDFSMRSARVNFQHFFSFSATQFLFQLDFCIEQLNYLDFNDTVEYVSILIHCIPFFSLFQYLSVSG